MECPTTASLCGLIGILLGCLIGNRLSIGRDRANRISLFVGKLSEIKSLSGNIDDACFPVWFLKSQASIEHECGVVESSIRLLKRKRFKTARAKYGSTQEKDIRDFDNSLLPMPRAIMTYGAGRRAVQGLIDELIACSVL